MGAEIPGRRVDPTTSVPDLEIGDYKLTAEGTLWGRAPGGDYTRIPADGPWTITEHDDGTVTVDPSIWINKPDGWHGHLVAGVWREV